MLKKLSRRVGQYTVNVVETFNNDVAKAEVGIELWRRFVRDQLPVIGDSSVAEPQNNRREHSAFAP